MKKTEKKGRNVSYFELFVYFCQRIVSTIKNIVIMKKFKTLVVAAATVVLSACGGGDILTGVLGGLAGTDGNAASGLGNVIMSVLGANKVSEAGLVGSWRYTNPGVAFTSSNVLAQAGGEVVAQEIEKKLLGVYNSVGIKSSNTYFTFAQNKQFEGKLLGTGLSGTYTYDPSSGVINMKTALLGININGYITGSTTGISLLFEGKKLLSLLQTVAALSGNSTLGAIGDLSTNYNGLRMGFDMSR